MARGFGDESHHYSKFNGNLSNGELPPSTRAAQLAEHFADDKRRPKNHDQESFQHLLREVLDAETDQTGQEPAFDADVGVHSKLIFVIVRAGIETDGHSNPFSTREQTLALVIDSLKALTITIRKTPSVLYTTQLYATNGRSDGNSVYRWLFPKVLPLFLSFDDVRIQTQIIEILRISIQSEQDQRSLKNSGRPILKYLRSLLRDTIHFLENATDDQEDSVELPTSKACRDPEAPEALSLGEDLSDFLPSFFVKGAPQVFAVAVLLISALIEAGKSISVARRVPTINVLVQRQWLMTLILQMWAASKDPSLGPGVSSVLSLSWAEMMVTSCTFLGNGDHISPDFTAKVRLSIVLSGALTSFLVKEQFTKEAHVEQSLSICLLQLIFFARSSGFPQRVLAENMQPILVTVCQNHSKMQGFGPDLQNALNLAVLFVGQSWLTGENNPEISKIVRFQDSVLSDKYQEIIQDANRADDTYTIVRPLKRARLFAEHETNKPTKFSIFLIQEMNQDLNSIDSSSIEDLQELFRNSYASMSDSKQTIFFNKVGSLACAITNNKSNRVGLQQKEPILESCTYCDMKSDGESTTADEDINRDLRAIVSLFETAIDLPKFQRSRQPRVAAVTALARVLCHFRDEITFDLANSKLGQWSLQALQSSIRELRVSAGRMLPIFLSVKAPQSLVSRNRLITLDFLRNLSDKCDLACQETCILAWSQLAQHLNDGDEKNLILLRLIDYLGHTNSLLCGLAFDELQRICNHSPYSAMRLFAPYWRTVAVAAIQDLHKKPQIAQQISDLLSLSVSEFLVNTQVHTIPYFVLTKRRDVLQRIAEACDKSIMSICREHGNLAAILSNILLQAQGDVENLVMVLLNAVSPEFKNVDCSELLKSEPQATATELLKAAGDMDEKRRSQAHQALQFLSNITHGRPSSSRASRRADMTGPFFENHVLGIMALLADTINDGKGPQPIAEKVRCVGAVREMIKLAKSHVSNGLPQICACLRSAMSNREICDHGFQAWIAMIDTLGEDDVAGLVDPTFALIIQYWSSISVETQNRVYEMISQLLKLRAPMIREVVHSLPSLAGIPLMAKFEEELSKLKSQMDTKHHFQSFSQRCQSENPAVVTSALRELVEYLEEHQDWLHASASNEQPDPVVGELTRSILDTSVSFSETDPEILIMCAKSLGLIGCLDYTKIEAVKEKKDIMVLSNFSNEDEVRDFVIFLLREVLVKAFLCATNSRSQGFLAYAMQELLAIAEFQNSVGVRARDASFDANYRRWVSLPESVRTLLTPFLDSKYFVTAGVTQAPCNYPLFSLEVSHKQWLRTMTFDLLKREPGNPNVRTLFSVLSRIIRSQDIAISEFLLPFAVLNVVIHGQEQEKLDIAKEMLAVLDQSLPDHSSLQDDIVLCSQTIFRVLDYLSRWMQEKKKDLSGSRPVGSRGGRAAAEQAEAHSLQISNVEALLSQIPADVISRRATECKSFSRALFHWEQYIRQERQKHIELSREFDPEPLYDRLQDIYTQIDEPDGVEGISAHLHVLNLDQQILEHRRAGRWTAAQSWYEMSLNERPKEPEIQYNLLTCLKESGQYDALLKQIDCWERLEPTKTMWLPFATEAAWVTGRWDKLRHYVDQGDLADGFDFNMGIGRALLNLGQPNPYSLVSILSDLRQTTARSLSHTSASSVQSSHDSLLKFHALAELEAVSSFKEGSQQERSALICSLDKRLNVIGPFPGDKQYVLGLRRAAMLRNRNVFTSNDIGSAWLSSARLARKGNATHQAFDATLHASQLGDDSAMIEHSRLLWHEGNHRKAIQSLEGAIAANAFRSHDYTENDESITAANDRTSSNPRNILKAKAHLLLAKWVDRAGQTQSDAIIHGYRRALECHNRWEKGHYYLGKHYNKLLESEKTKPPSKQAQTYITGEIAKLVVENYLRSLAFGAKYIYQTLPRILTLWLDLGSECEQPLDPKYGNDDSFRTHTVGQRRKLLAACNAQVKKYADRLPAFVFYTALAQIVARICHPHQAVYNLLVDIVTKIVFNHPPQALWALLAMVKSSSKDRAHRGATCLARVLEMARKARNEASGSELKTFVSQSQKLSDQLLHVCEFDIQGRASNISLSKDLGFNHKTAVCKLAVPLEASLTANLPTASENVTMRAHKAFNSHDYVHISSFLDDVLVLNSLQRPRKISIRGSDGRVYALLCKPKDDLRKDQRLMEFNSMINRALKKDADSSKRRLYIKTYAVTPLNEECGLIEWVDNLKTLREILLHSYKQKNVNINYNEMRMMLNEAISTPNKLPIFTDKIIPYFPPVFHEWFVEMFPEPGAWFTARLRYTRSAAVMSMVGHVLGLGDRHGENILFEEGNGGTLHVDFNCLFDKGLTFEKPELVPFRLTHNMVDAFGAHGYEGPYRKSCELSLGILRSNEDTLMTILETFLYDPTTDFIGKKKKVNPVVPDTPEGVLENVRNKVRGLLPGESVPLSVEGYVDELIRQALDPWRLASMYIGWCAFF